MNLYNLLRCGYTFSEDEYELETRYVMTTVSLFVVSIILLIASLAYYIISDYENASLHSLAFVFIMFSLYLTRKVGKDNYHALVYAMTLFFTLLIMYGYYMNPEFYPVSTWITIQILASFLILDISLGVLIMISFVVYIFMMNEILGYNSFQYVILQLIPVFISLILIYFIKQKFSSTILLLEDSNKYLEERICARTMEIEDEKNKLAHQANHDFLTDLPNRNKFHHVIRQWIKRDVDRSLHFSLLFLDLDRFKRVNDSLGHNIGDEVLIMVANRIKKVISEENFFARISGDEFILIIRHNDNKNLIDDLAQKLIQIIEEPMLIEEYRLYISASIGISQYPKDSVHYAELIKYADTTMFEAKKIGKGRYKFYTKQMSEHIQEIVSVESEIHMGIENNEFILYYQPQIDMRTEKITGLEILVRWEHPNRGFLSPDSFISLAEETGVIIMLDYYILKRGMQQIYLWKNTGFDIPCVSFNFSTKHLHQTGFVDIIEALLVETGCKGEWIELEITESHIVSNIEESIIVLNTLKALGISIAIDDFGTGYSSLTYLKRLPSDKLKIDKYFIEQILNDQIDMTITKAIIEIGNSMGLTVIAEGVETEFQKEYLLAQKCFHVQGHLYYKAMLGAEMEKKGIFTKSF